MEPAKDDETRRKRRSHRKSRLGCANCKLRSVKCDETKPHCKRCRSFGIRCIYGSKLSPDVLNTDACFSVTISPTVVRSPPALLPVSGSADSPETYQLVLDDMKLVDRFQTSTVLTLGSRSSRYHYADKLLPLAFSNASVMHAVLALAQIHSLALDVSAAAQNRRAAGHWHEAVTSLHRKLSQPIRPAEYDSLWILAALISIGSFASTEARSPAEAWPLRPASEADLSWLKLCDGKKLVWQLTNPMRDEGSFRLSATELEFNLALMQDAASRTIGRESLPPGLYDLFDVSKGPVDNPYYSGAVAMAEVLRLELNAQNFLPHLSFISVLDSRFRTLLRHRDERAMVMLLYWYAKICDRQLWWMWKQAWTEGLAICEYLERRWAKEPQSFQLLMWPRMSLIAASLDKSE